MSPSLRNGTGAGSRPFTRVKFTSIEKVGAEYATFSPGAANARSAPSITSSEPQPVMTWAAVTPAYAASASRSSTGSEWG